MASGTKKKLSEIAFAKLYDMIVCEREFLPGEKLPNENELSEMLEVSRTTTREAISQLSAQGIVVIRRGKGTFVAEDLPSDGMDLSALSAVRSRVRAKDLFEMRLIFEPETAAMACKRAADDEIEGILKKAENVERLAEKGGDWAKADQEFHWSLMKASHNEYMKKLYPIINSAVAEIQAISDNMDVMKEIAVNDNRLITNFLKRRDSDGARAAMNLHIRHMINTME